MELNEAVELVLKLARESISWDLIEVRKGQIEACNLIEDFAVNHLGQDDIGDQCCFVRSSGTGWFCWTHKHLCPGPLPYCDQEPWETPLGPREMQAVRTLWDALSEILEDSSIATYLPPELRANGLKAIEKAVDAFPVEA
jgi:hypothetical protein